MTNKREKSKPMLRLISFLGITTAIFASHVFAHEPETVEPSDVGIPYSWLIELSANEHAEAPPDHVGAWSWDEDGFPATARGWTHTSKWVKLKLTQAAQFTLTLESRGDVPWPSPAEPTRLAGTNLFPSFSLYRGWDTDAGWSVDQDHTFNNRGNIEWAEDVTYLDHLDNSTSHKASRTWSLAAGEYTISLGGNSPAVAAEGRQGFQATFKTTPVAGSLTNAIVFAMEPSPVGVPYGWGLVMDDSSTAQTSPDHVGAWSWDEDGFPATAKGWTHTSKWVKLELTKPAQFTLRLESLKNVPWPSPAEPARMAGTNLFPAFSIYRGWDTDGGITVDTNGVTIDQDHTFNNRGNITWAEDVTYLDHLDNATTHQTSRTWTLPAGRYTISLGGSSPATIAEGRQGYLATFSTTPASALTSGIATISYDKAAVDKLASAVGPAPVLTLSGFFDQAAANSLALTAILTNAQTGFSHVNQPYAMNGPVLSIPADRTAQPTTFAWVPGNPTNHTGSIGLGGIARFSVLGGVGGNLAFGDFTLQFDAARIALGGSGWYLKGNIAPAAAVYDITNVKVVETTTSLSISGDLAVSFEVANFLFSTPADALKDVGDFSFTGHKIANSAPRISSVAKSGVDLLITAVNGTPGSICVLLSSTTIAADAGSWIPGVSGTFDASGTCKLTVPLNSAEPSRFFKLRTP